MLRPSTTSRRTAAAHGLRLSAAAGALGALATVALAGPALAATSEVPTPSGFYSSKQPYVAPDAADLEAYSPAPAGYETIATESVARHGSRGLSGYKYDALLHRLAETAQADGGFLTPEIGTTFVANLDAITAANVENGYGMLTGQGATQHQGIGARAYQRNAALFAEASAAGDRIVAETSGEARATESGENFLIGFADAAATAASPVPALDAPLVAHPERLYFHKVENPDGTDKAEGTPEREIADAYDAYIEEQTDDGGTIAAATDFIEDLPRSVEVADELLSGIFTPEFIAQIGADDAHTWFNTVDGTEAGAVACAPGADPASDPDACGDPEKSIESSVDAAMTLYNLYIIAVDMQEENVAPHAFDFNAYFVGHEADAEWFAYLLDSEDFYEKGPSLAGHDETYRIARPLLDDFFATIDARIAGGDVAATFRFAHAETIVPFAALLRLPGSTVAAPDVAEPATSADVYDYAANPWRGAEVTPMAANVQWDVVTRDGVDPETGAAYTPLVRMLYNEREIAFAAGCTPVAEGSNWVKATELKRCLADVATTESPLIADGAASAAADTAGPQLAETGVGTGAATAALLLVMAGAAASVIAVRSRRAVRG
ncbi:histidine-type phosphatase [Agromyces aureus]|uniref:Multiple inositol polyphosphate phosphatase 1 n=1 Tax=Agromyces aureus TaxID=453304 RepID=A0A191WE77_9MICO|nr:histidine-type phosphatase [Agromyces aureus]ANJ26527.1 histidine acid phosphatase [Agromyces aureus]